MLELDAARRRVHAVARRRRHGRPGRDAVALEQGPRTQSIMPDRPTCRPRRCTRPWTPPATTGSRSPASTPSSGSRPAADLADSERAQRSSSPAAATRADRARSRRCEPSDVARRPPRRRVDDARARQRHRAHRSRRRRRTARRRACASTRCPACGDDECPAVFPPDPAERPTPPAAADEGHPGRAGQHARVVHGGQRGRASACCASRPDGTRARPDALHLRLPGAARPRARPVRRRVVHRGRDQPHRPPDARREPALRRRPPRGCATTAIPSASLVDEPELVAGAGAHLQPALPGHRPARARVVHRERDGQARRSSTRSAARHGTTRRHRRDRPARTRTSARRRRPPTSPSTAPARCSGPTSTATSSAPC